MIGINASGGEYSWASYPGPADLDLLHGKGCKLVRVPFAWEKLQPALMGPLAAAEVALLRACLDNCAARGMTALIDMHNYGRYNANWLADGAANYGNIGVDPWAVTLLGSSQVPNAAFADAWSKLAVALMGHPGLAGYDLMNEPHDMGGPSVWPTAAQAAINAIRAVDAATPIYVEGDAWASDFSQLASLIGAGLVFELHSYWDDGSSNYALTYAQQGATPQSGVSAVQPFLQWLTAHGKAGFVGEFGVPHNDPQWLPVLDNFLKAVVAAGVGGTYWDYCDPPNKPADAGWWPPADSKTIRDASSPVLALLAPYMSGTVAPPKPPKPIISGSMKIYGTAQPGSTVTVSDGTVALGGALVGADGAWAFTATLATGTHSLTAVAKNAGGSSPASAVRSVTVR